MVGNLESKKHVYVFICMTLFLARVNGKRKAHKHEQRKSHGIRCKTDCIQRGKAINLHLRIYSIVPSITFYSKIALFESPNQSITHTHTLFYLLFSCNKNHRKKEPFKWINVHFVLLLFFFSCMCNMYLLVRFVLLLLWILLIASN